MAIRLSGMISGMDTDALVQELVSAYSVKKDKYVKAQTKLEWQMDAWKSLNTKVYSFYTNKLSPMRFSTAYSKKTASVSDSTKATVKAENSAVNGTQSLQINKLATTGYLTGAKLNTGEKVTASTKLSELNGGSSSGVLSVSVDGKDTDIELTDDMNVGQLVSKLKEAGLNASFDETNQRFFISSKTSGKDHDFSITGDTNGTVMMKSLGIFSVSQADMSSYLATAKYSDSVLENMALNDYLKNQISEANKTFTERNAALTEENTKLNQNLTYAKMGSADKAITYADIQEKIKKLQEEIDGLDSTDDAEAIAEKKKQKKEYEDTLKIYDEINANTLTADGISDKITKNTEEIKANEAAIEDNNKIVENTLSTDEIKAAEFTKYDATNGTEKSKVSTDDSVYKAQYLKKYQDLRSTAQDIVSKAQNAGAVDSNGKIVDAQKLAEALGTSAGVRIDGVDSEIVLNGATFTSNSNNYSINGLTITANALTAPGEEISITTATDVDGIYNMIKDTLKEYNTLIKEMDTLYNAPRAKGYEPLTDEEKDAMSDTEVEKWEKKIKDSLLRRDNTLGSVISTMKMDMSKSYMVGDKEYSLGSFGISTQGYFASGENEKGVYHIDGDSDDGITSGNADKLRAAIASDPDTVVSFFTQLTKGLYDNLTKKMASSSVSSAYTLYNDKQMKKNYEAYDDTIEKWEEKVKNMEDKYYDQFAAMEKALAQLQSSTSSLSALMGTQ